MKKINYLDIILFGLENHKDFLSDYFIRQWEGMNISIDEFVQELLKELKIHKDKLLLFLEQDKKNWEMDKKLPKEKRYGFSEPKMENNELYTSNMKKGIILTKLKSIKFDDLVFVENIVNGLKSKREGNKKPGEEIKLKWRGNQKQFGELIDQLQEKEWIDKIKDGDLSSIVRNLCSCFDLSQTKKKNTSDIENSLRQILTPSEKETKIYSKRYAKNFGSISVNIQKKKK